MTCGRWSAVSERTNAREGLWLLRPEREIANILDLSFAFSTLPMPDASGAVLVLAQFTHALTFRASHIPFSSSLLVSHCSLSLPSGAVILVPFAAPPNRRGEGRVAKAAASLVRILFPPRPPDTPEDQPQNREGRLGLRLVRAV